MVFRATGADSSFVPCSACVVLTGVVRRQHVGGRVLVAIIPVCYYPSVGDSSLHQTRLRSVTAGALIIAVGFVLSKVVGLVRTSVLLARFGAGDATDVYLAAFKVPDLIFNILVLGALSAAFIPVFLQYWNHGDEQPGAWQLASGLMVVLVLTIGGLAAVAAAFAPQLVPLIAPGFDAAKQSATVGLTRIMLLATVLFAFSNVLSGILTALRRFLAYSLAPLFYNVGIIFGIVVLEPVLGIAGLAWGVVLGAALHLLIQLPAVIRAGFRFRPRGLFGHTGVRKILKLMAPRTLGLAVSQVEQTVSVIIASTLAVGSVTVLAAANDLQTFSINVVGVSMAISVFPLFSQAFIEKDTRKFAEHFSRSVRRILLLIVPISVLLLLLRAHIVRVIFGFGQFDWEDTILTAQALGIFALSLFAQSLIPVLARSFYALQDTFTPVKVSVVSVVVNISLAIVFSRLWGVLGIAFAFSIANLLQMSLLYAILRIRVGDLDDAYVLRSTSRVLFASAGLAAVVWLMLRVLVAGVDQATRIGLFLQAGVAGILGIIVYVGLILLFAPDEATMVRNWLKRLLRLERRRVEGS